MNKADEEFAARIRKECMTGDNEGDHATADEILIEILVGLGYRETAKAWSDVAKWYA